MIDYLKLFGFFFNIILLIISSSISCGKENIYIANFCHSIVYKRIKNTTETFYYFDNFFSYIDDLNYTFYPFKYNDTSNYDSNIRLPKDAILEILFSFIFPIIGFFKTTYDLFIIKELGVFHLLIPEAIYQLFKDLIIIIYKISNNINDKIQTIQFLFILLSNLFSIIGLSIFLELIVLRFCGLDENTKQNIIYRSIMDKKEIEEEFDNDFRYSNLKEDRENDNNEDNNY